MNFFKFFKFSKLLSACVSFGVLFSGFQTSGMEGPKRLNLDMLGIGIRNNSGDDNESVTTKNTVASPLDDIKVKIPEHCEFCNGEVSRCAVCTFSGPNSKFICKNSDCMQRCYNKFLNLKGLEPKKLYGDIHRCDDFTRGMEKFKKFKDQMERLKKSKEANDKTQFINKQIEKVEQIFWPLCREWEGYIGDEFLDAFWLSCGHSVCFCGLCAQKFKQKLQLCGIDGVKTGMWRCPKCGDRYRKIIMKLTPVWKEIECSSVEVLSKSTQLFNEKLNDDWKNRVIIISKNKDVDVAGRLSDIFCPLDWFSPDNGYDLIRRKFMEDKFSVINDKIILEKKILVVSDTVNGNECSDFRRFSKSFDQCLNFLDVSKLNGYIKALIKNGEYQTIIYPVKGKLHDEIEAIAVKFTKEAIAALKFIKDNTIIMSKERYYEILADIATKDGVE